MQLYTQEIIKKIPSYVLDTANTLFQNNYEAYLVGGSVRDLFLDKTPTDYDIATNAYPEEVMKIFPKSIPTGAKFGTITVIGQDENGERFDVQVTTYRSEADYFGGRWPAKVEFAKKIEDDLSRRDFTINALALNLNPKAENRKPKIEDDSPVVIQRAKSVNHFEQNMNVSKDRHLGNENNDLIDLFGGLQDLENKIIKAVNNPVERFTEDGLRAVRACRLASQLDFEIEKNTFDAISKTLHITKLVSVERFRDELMKTILKSPKPSKGLRLMKESGILELFIPEMLEGVGIVQPEFHSDDVFEHSLASVDIAEDDIKLAALFHDIGKPRTKKEDENGIHFYGHDVVGAEMTEEIMRRLKFSNEEIDLTTRLIRWHMFYYPSAIWRDQSKALTEQEQEQEQNEDQRPVTSDQRLEKEQNEELGIKNSELEKDKMENGKWKMENSHGWTDGAIRRLINNVGGEEAIDKLLKLRIADQLSNKKYDFNEEELKVFSERVARVRAEEMALKVKDLDISGEDLIKEFNLTAGPEIGKILNYLLEKVLDEPILNKKETLLGLAKELLETEKIKNEK